MMIKLLFTTKNRKMKFEAVEGFLCRKTQQKANKCKTHDFLNKMLMWWKISECTI